MLPTAFLEAFALLETEEVLLLMRFTRLAPLDICPDLIQDVIQSAHFLEPLNSRHFFSVLIVSSWEVDDLAVEDVVVLALIDELQLLELFWGESEEVFS